VWSAQVDVGLRGLGGRGWTHLPDAEGKSEAAGWRCTHQQGDLGAAMVRVQESAQGAAGAEHEDVEEDRTADSEALERPRLRKGEEVDKRVVVSASSSMRTFVWDTHSLSSGNDKQAVRGETSR
jgi:hypothetical protein